MFPEQSAACLSERQVLQDFCDVDPEDWPPRAQVAKELEKWARH